MSQGSEEYQAWRKVLIRVLGETTTEMLENLVKSELEHMRMEEEESGRG